MRLFLSALAAAACLLFAAPAAMQPAAASGYANGYCEDGYTWRNGYWWRDGIAYKRVRYRRKVWYNCGLFGCRSCYRWEYYWRYIPVDPQPASRTYITPETPGWRAKLLEIAKQRDEIEGKMRMSALEHSEFIESVRLLGLESNFRWQGYGAGVTYSQAALSPVAPLTGAFGSYYSQLPQAQGNTVYGYGLSTLIDVYGNVDLGALFQQALRLRQQSAQAESKATSEVHALLGQLDKNVSRIQEIQAKGEAAAKVLKAAEPKDRVTLLQQFWQQTPQRVAQSLNGKTQAVHQSVALIFRNKCVSCHSADKAEGDLNLEPEQLAGLSFEARQSIFKRVLTDDPAKRMPKGGELTPEEKGVIVAWALETAAKQQQK